MVWVRIGLVYEHWPANDKRIKTIDDTVLKIQGDQETHHHRQASEDGRSRRRVKDRQRQHQAISAEEEATLEAGVQVQNCND